MNRIGYKIHVVILGYVLLTTICHNASGKDYYFKHYDRSSGLAQQTVFCSVQDKNGFMWFGTKAGLSRFDGKNFKTYIHSEHKKNSLPSNIIHSIAEGPDGILWLGTDKGLCKYYPEKDSFQRFECDEFSIEIDIDHVLFDKQGNLWAINSDGIYFVSEISRTCRFYPADEYFWPTGMTVTQAGKICILGKDGYLHIMEASKGETASYQILTKDEIKQKISLFNVIECTAGELLITTSSAGARILSLNTGETTSLFSTDAEGKQIFIYCALQPSPGEFWFGSETGIHIFKLGSGFTDHLTKTYDSRYSLSDNAVHSLSIDRDNGIWAGTFFGGLNYLSNDNTVFEKYLPRDASGSIRANVVRTILPDSKGNLWIGTEDGGLCWFNTSTREFSTLDRLNWKGDPLAENIQGLLLLDHRYLWIGSYDRGLYVMDITSNKIIKHYSNDDPDSGLSSCLISFLTKTEQGDILVGTQNGLFMLDKEEDRFKVLDNMSFGFIHSLYEDTDHALWIGCLGHGLFKTDALALETGSAITQVPFPSGRITSISGSYESNIWVSTEDKGLFRLEKETGLATSVLPRDSFSGIIVYQVVEDPVGTVWISTSDGLVRCDPSMEVFDRYTTANGLPIDEFNYNSSYQDRTGNIYMGSLKGLVCFSPEQLHLDHYTPKVYFTGFWIYDKEIESSEKGSPLKKSILFTDKIDLGADQSAFRIQFAAPNYATAQNIWYRYRLDGLETEWKMSFGPRQLDYTKIPAGKYTLEVQASNNPVFWGKDYSSLQIVLHPPFWKSTFAKALYFMMLCAMCLFIFASMKRKMRMTEKAHIERLNNEKEKEVLESKISFFTNITHEIRTPLTLIMLSLERISKKDQSVSPNDDDLSVMSRNTGRLYELVNQLLDFRKVESSNLYLQFAELNLNEFLKDIFCHFAPAAQNKGAEMNLTIEDSTFEITADKEALTKIISNLLTNALKFCEKKVDIYLSYASEDNDETVRIRINNDGDIIPKSEAEAIFKPFHQYRSEKVISSTKGSGLGLALARSLAEMHNGKLYYDSDDTACNSFILDLPLSQKPSAEADERNARIISETPVHAEDKSSPVKSQQTLLIVEDDEDLIRYLSEELSVQYTVFTASNGETALNVLEHNIISLIISDIMMPVMDGITLCNKVRNNIRFCHIPIIILTAKVSMQAHLEVLESKADAYIEKPFSTEHLKAQVSNLLANRELMRSTVINSPYAHLSSVASNSKDEDFIEKMNNFVMDKLADTSLSVETLAEHMNMSLSTLFRKVKSTTSLSPNDFIKLCRLKKAAELLSSGELRVNEVAEDVGFTKASYFASCFMKQFGMTPRDFVKMSRTQSYSTTDSTGTASSAATGAASTTSSTTTSSAGCSL